MHGRRRLPRGRRRLGRRAHGGRRGDVLGDNSRGNVAWHVDGDLVVGDLGAHQGAVQVRSRDCVREEVGGVDVLLQQREGELQLVEHRAQVFLGCHRAFHSVQIALVQTLEFLLTGQAAALLFHHPLAHILEASEVGEGLFALHLRRPNRLDFLLQLAFLTLAEHRHFPPLFFDQHQSQLICLELLELFEHCPLPLQCLQPVGLGGSHGLGRVPFCLPGLEELALRTAHVVGEHLQPLPENLCEVLLGLDCLCDPNRLGLELAERPLQLRPALLRVPFQHCHFLLDLAHFGKQLLLARAHRHLLLVARFLLPSNHLVPSPPLLLERDAQVREMLLPRPRLLLEPRQLLLEALVRNLAIVAGALDRDARLLSLREHLLQPRVVLLDARALLGGLRGPGGVGVPFGLLATRGLLLLAQLSLEVLPLLLQRPQELLLAFAGLLIVAHPLLDRPHQLPLLRFRLHALGLLLPELLLLLPLVPARDLQRLLGRGQLFVRLIKELLEAADVEAVLLVLLLHLRQLAFHLPALELLLLQGGLHGSQLLLRTPEQRAQPIQRVLIPYPLGLGLLERLAEPL
mmetsp:Transcript_20663/g.50027  ORF Transcript_20663/g.50027 Transcript_20663/m.50027 type:complete len:573 (-) Transcript_20663:877-2595(-)